MRSNRSPCPLLALVFLVALLPGCGHHPSRPAVSSSGLIGTWSDGKTTIQVAYDSSAYCTHYADSSHSTCGTWRGPMTFGAQGDVFYDSGVGVRGEEDDDWCGTFPFEQPNGRTSFSAVLNASQTRLSGSISYWRFSGCADGCLIQDTRAFSLTKL